MGIEKREKKLSGLLLIHKPYGMISKDVSRWIQKRYGKQKLGHVGTLDPLASGVLPIVFGRATRLQDYLLEMDKTYEFDLFLGKATRTMDVEGEVFEELPWDHVTQEQLQNTASSLVGTFYQVPPIYSAIKYMGKPLYEYARSGHDADVPLADLAKNVEVKSLELLGFSGRVASFRMSCSKGTYVRVVADRIARQLKTCGHVSRLVRLRAAGYDLSQSVDLQGLEEDLDRIDGLLVPVSKINISIAKWRAMDSQLVQRLKHGQVMKVSMRAFEDGLDASHKKRVTIHSVDQILLLDKDKKSFGIGSAKVSNDGMVAIQMRRGL